MIWIITSGTENYNLIKLCHKFNLSYCIIADTELYPYQEKDIQTLEKRIDTLIQYGQELGCTQFLLSPIVELYYIHILYKNESIIPLFKNYINHCFQYSLIGKIWYIWGYMEEKNINTIHTVLSENYTLTDNQTNTKTFMQPLAKRTKDISMWTYFSRFTSSRNMIINKIIKFDLRYFKDAHVDTIIPLSYEYFNYQRTISSFFNPKKQKFHKREVMETLLSNIIQEYSLPTQTQSEVIVVVTWSDHLLTNKKWETIASHWWQYTLTYKTITIQ